jgi:hypothetical protein
MIQNKMMKKVFLTLIIFFFQNINCRITNPAIGILTQSKIYLAQINEFNYTNDDLHLIYHHNDHVYPLESFASNNALHRIYICSPSTIYTLDLRVGAHIVPLSPIDDTPCRSSLTYLSGQATLVWALRHAVIQLNFQDMSKERIWNSTSSILDMIYNHTIDDDNIVFYLSISIVDQQSSVLHCRADRRFRIFPFQSCLFIDSGYREVSALAIEDNRLYVADRIQQKIYVLTLSPSSFILTKGVLPLNTSTVADIASMFIYDHNLVWLTTSGHVRIVSLVTYEVRNLFWFDEQLRTIRLVSFSQWPNRTTTTITTKTTRQSSTTYSTSTEVTATSSTSPSEQIDTTTIDDDNNSPWKATTYVTAVFLGIALFLCAAMITCVLLNYRLGRVVPHSFTNIFHILRNRPATRPAAVPELLEESLT